MYAFENVNFDFNTNEFACRLPLCRKGNGPGKNSFKKKTVVRSKKNDFEYCFQCSQKMDPFQTENCAEKSELSLSQD